MDSNHVHQAGARFRAGMRGRPAPLKGVRGPSFRRSQIGSTYRYALSTITTHSLHNSWSLQVKDGPLSARRSTLNSHTSTLKSDTEYGNTQ